MKNSTFKFAALVLSLILTFATPLSVSAATIPEVNLPNASYYLTSYGGSVNRLGGGAVQVYFSVTSTSSSMAKVGATRIVLEESSDNVNWSGAATYHYSSYPSMMGSGTRYNTTVPAYQGTSGWYYRAYITVWAGTSMTTGDSRSFWTTTVQAT